MQSVSISIKGSKRVVNQDSFFADDNLGIYLVADGMGGHKAGEVASRMAVKVISEITAKDKSKGGIVRAFDDANRAVLEKSMESEEYKGMGTTAVCCLIEGGQALVAHVGDSRAYMLKGRVMSLLTKDHSLVEKLLESGQITEKEAETHPMRNMIYKAIGMSDGDCFDSDGDMDEAMVEQGDILLLCSDGLSGSVGIEDIKKVLESDKFENVTKVLGDMAVKNGSTDDITIIAIKVL